MAVLKQQMETQAKLQAEREGLRGATTLGQANTAYDQQQAALSQQANFVNALNAQNGLANQAQVFGQLQGIANGTGPNPVQAQLANATGANVANQSALAAGQRGAAANAGLIARQAAMQGANIQQNAAGQAAALGAQQQLGAIGAMGNLANQQVAQQAGGIQGYNQAALQGQGNILGAIQGQNSNETARYTGQLQKDIADSDRTAKMVGGLLGGVGSVFGFAEGGEVPATEPKAGPRSKVAQYFAGGGAVSKVGQVISDFSRGFSNAFNPGGPQIPRRPAAAPAVAISGAPVASLQPTDTDWATKMGAPSAAAPGDWGALLGAPGSEPEKLAKGGNVGAKLKAGGKVPGQAKVKGDSFSNDTVDAKLSPGEIVLPRSVTQSQDPVGNAAAFVQAVMAKKGLRRG